MRRALSGQATHIGGVLGEIASFADEARQQADREERTRWAVGRFAVIARGIHALAEEARELSRELSVSGGARAASLGVGDR